jgi:hypothetical protein
VGDSEELGSGSFAYLVEKPAGCLFSVGLQTEESLQFPMLNEAEAMDPAEMEAKLRKKHTKAGRWKTKTVRSVIEYSELGMLAWMTPEEWKNTKKGRTGNAIYPVKKRIKRLFLMQGMLMS